MLRIMGKFGEVTGETILSTSNKNEREGDE
jgi:hypothetical protein